MMASESIFYVLEQRYEISNRLTDDKRNLLKIMKELKLSDSINLAGVEKVITKATDRDYPIYDFEFQQAFNDLKRIPPVKGRSEQEFLNIHVDYVLKSLEALQAYADIDTEQAALDSQISTLREKMTILLQIFNIVKAEGIVFDRQSTPYLHEVELATQSQNAIVPKRWLALALEELTGLYSNIDDNAPPEKQEVLDDLIGELRRIQTARQMIPATARREPPKYDVSPGSPQEFVPPVPKRDITEDMANSMVLIDGLLTKLEQQNVLTKHTHTLYTSLFSDATQGRPVNDVLFRHLTLELQEAMLKLSQVNKDLPAEIKANSAILLSWLTVIWTQTIQLYTKLSAIHGTRTTDIDIPPPPPFEEDFEVAPPPPPPPEEEFKGAPPPPPPPEEEFKGAPPPPPSKGSDQPSSAPTKKGLFRGANLWAQSESPPETSQPSKGSDKEPSQRSALLEGIRKGTQLKKVGPPPESKLAKKEQSGAQSGQSAVGSYNPKLLEQEREKELQKEIASRRGAIAGDDVEDDVEDEEWDESEAQIRFIAANMLRQHISPKMEAQLIGHPAFQPISMIALRLPPYTSKK